MVMGRNRKLGLDYFPMDVDFFQDIRIRKLKYKLDHEGKRLFNINVKEWKRISKAVFKRDNYTCQYCGKVGGKLEVDHIFPFSKGGSDSLENLTTSCQKCNRQKRDKSVDDFFKMEG